jgi:hypothetical protein
MLDTTDSTTLAAGNNSAVTPYPVAWPSLDPAHVKVRVIAVGSGTVAVAAGVATFSASQTLEIGGRVRIATTTYVIATRVSATVYTFTVRPTISATTFWLMDVFTELAPADFSYTLDGSGVLDAIVTDVAVPVTSLVLIYRQTPPLQLVTLPVAGSLPAATLERMADRNTMIEQETRAMIDGTVSGVVGGTVPTGGTGLTGLTAYALLAGGTTSTAAMQQVSGLGTLSPQQYLGSNGAAALPTWKTPAFGDVFGPAVSGTSNLAIFADTTGKLLKSRQETNGNATSLDLGDVTDATPRPLTIFQTVDNAALVAQLVILNLAVLNATAAATIQEWQNNGSNRAKLLATGHFRLLDGTLALPIYSFENAPDSGLYWDGSKIVAVIGAAAMMKVGPADVTVLGNLIVSIAATTRLIVSPTEVGFGAALTPLTDNSFDLGLIATRVRNAYLAGGVMAALHATPAAPTTIASAGTIAPTSAVTSISGTAAISTITVPSFISATAGRLTLLPTGVFTWDTAGNIALAGTAVVNKALDFTWNATSGKWTPHYIA